MKYEFEVVLSYKYDEKHKKAAEQITKLYKDKFDMDIYKILFQYDDTMDMLSCSKKAKVYPSKNSKLRQMFFYFKTNKQLHDYMRISNITSWVRYDSDNDGMNNALTQILKSCGFDTSIFHRALYKSIEELALEYTYRNESVRKDFKEYREKVFNPNTMKSIAYWEMYIVYKTKELLEQAYASGETEKIKADYYDFMKKHDPFNLISRDEKGNYRHLFIRFDSPETELDFMNHIYGYIIDSMSRED